MTAQSWGVRSHRCVATRLAEFNKFLGIVSQIEALLGWNKVYSPLLHRQGPKEHVYGPAFFIPTDFIDDHSVGGYLVAFNVRVKSCAFSGSLDGAAQRGSESFGQLECNQKRSDGWHDVSVPRTGV